MSEMLVEGMASYEKINDSFSRSFFVNFLQQGNKETDEFQIFSNGFENKRDKLYNTCDIQGSGKKSLETCENLYWFPEYLNEVRPTTSEYYFEWKGHLLKKNFEEIQNATTSKDRFSFYTPKIVKTVFNICKLFRQPPEVRYLALDVLDRFLVEHFYKVAQTFEEMDEDSPDMWDAIVDRMLNQSPLRILTSIQLAMKYAWSSNVMTATDIQEALEYLGHKEQYPKKSILKSEARIFSHLNFNIPYNTPFRYLELFFAAFQKHEFFILGIPLHDFFITCIHVLDITIIFHKEIYENLERRLEMQGSTTVSTIKANFVLLASSVIYVSSILVDPNMNKTKLLLETLCFVGECGKSDVESLGNELYNFIINM